MASQKVGRVAIMQPYFFPAPSYFHLLHAVDTFVFFDDVQFVTKRWTHRNRLMIDGDEYRFTVPLSGRSQNRRIDEIRVHPHEYSKWRRKFLTTLRLNYGHVEAIDDVEAVLAGEDMSLADLAIRSVEWVAARIGLSPRFVRSSQIDYDRDADLVGKLLSICGNLNATTYVNAPGGRALYESADFAPAGITLRFIAPRPIREEFTNLSILHPLLTLAPEDVHDLVASYTLEGDGAHG